MYLQPPDRLLNATFLREDVQIWIERQALVQPYPLHWHEFYELTFVLAGAGSNAINGVPHAVQAGDLYLLTPTDFHEIAPAPGATLHLYNVNFPQSMLTGELAGDLADVVLANKIGSLARFPDGAGYQAVLPRFERIMAEYAAPSPGSRALVRAEITCLLVEWMRRHGAPPAPAIAGRRPATAPSGHCHPGIQKSLLYIEHHFRQPLSLEEAARRAHLSSNYYSELFRKSTGTTFQSYLQRLRLRFADALLRSSAVPVTDVAFASGFNTLSHFERAFRTQYGQSPREARKAGRDRT